MGPLLNEQEVKPIMHEANNELKMSDADDRLEIMLNVVMQRYALSSTDRIIPIPHI